jgi:predicted regulator of Ras-like GTPase activity (Roadblock/LC7/MglB family)
MHTGTGLDPQPGQVPRPGEGSQSGGLSREARNLQWLLQNFVHEVQGVRSVAVVSSDGLLLLSSQPGSTPAVPGPVEPGAQPAGARMDLAAVVSGLSSLTDGAARLMDGGRVRQTTVAMDDGMLVVMAVSDGSLLGVHATADSDISIVAYHMALFVGRAGHVLTPALRSELSQATERGR